MMLKILVFSDSHGSLLSMYDAIEREQPDAVIHLGDYDEDARDLQRSYPDLQIWRVRGNNDYGTDSALHAVIRPNGVPIYLTHGHYEHVMGTSTGRLTQHAREAGCVWALFGHTHRALYGECEGIRVLNPGSISLPRGGPASYARLTIAEGAVRQVTLLRADGEPLYA